MDFIKQFRFVSDERTKNALKHEEERRKMKERHETEKKELKEKLEKKKNEETTTLQQKINELNRKQEEECRLLQEQSEKEQQEMEKKIEKIQNNMDALAKSKNDLEMKAQEEVNQSRAQIRDSELKHETELTNIQTESKRKIDTLAEERNQVVQGGIARVMELNGNSGRNNGERDFVNILDKTRTEFEEPNNLFGTLTVEIELYKINNKPHKAKAVLRKLLEVLRTYNSQLQDRINQIGQITQFEEKEKYRKCFTELRDLIQLVLRTCALLNANIEGKKPIDDNWNSLEEEFGTLRQAVQNIPPFYANDHVMHTLTSAMQSQNLAISSSSHKSIQQ